MRIAELFRPARQPLVRERVVRFTTHARAGDDRTERDQQLQRAGVHCAEDVFQAVQLGRSGLAERVEVQCIEESGGIRARRVENGGDVRKRRRKRLRHISRDVPIADLRGIEPVEVGAQLVVCIRAAEEDQRCARLTGEGESGLETDALAAAGDEQRVRLVERASRVRLDVGHTHAGLEADPIPIRCLAEVTARLGLGHHVRQRAVVERVDVDDPHGDLRPLHLQRAREAGAARRLLHDDQPLAIGDGAALEQELDARLRVVLGEDADDAFPVGRDEGGVGLRPVAEDLPPRVGRLPCA